MHPYRQVGRRIGGSARALGIVAVPTAIAKVCGIMEFAVMDDVKVPPLTPINLIHSLGGIIDTPAGKLRLSRPKVEQSFERLPSGHLQHSITDFPEPGWTAPAKHNPEQYRSDPQSQVSHVEFPSGSRSFLAGWCGSGSSSLEGPLGLKCSVFVTCNPLICSSDAQDEGKRHAALPSLRTCFPGGGLQPSFFTWVGRCCWQPPR